MRVLLRAMGVGLLLATAYGALVATVCGIVYATAVASHAILFFRPLG